MLADLIAAQSWSHEQWLIVSMMSFMVVACVVVAYRSYTIFKTVKRKRERPNLRLRRRHRG
ncbi:MAG: hypothetical protein R3332_09430 [Pseudohongiellaceae bacterium]|nr:hypothetical protein [Pseudohongiellaceae bacterium]